MNADDKEDFLSRWSRLKKGARGEEKLAELDPPAAPPPPVAPNPPGAAVSSPQAQTPLPSIDSLKGLASEYAGFLKPGVSEDLKRAALKKLFSDPHFEAFERFEAYCEDYTIGEPIPAAMLKTLEHAKGLLFDEEKKDTPKETPAAADKPAAEALPDPAGRPETQVPTGAPSGSADAERNKA